MKLFLKKFILAVSIEAKLLTKSAGDVLLKHSRGIALAIDKTSVTFVSVGILSPRFFACSLDTVALLLKSALAMSTVSAEEKFFKSVGLNKPIWSWIKNDEMIQIIEHKFKVYLKKYLCWQWSLQHFVAFEHILKLYCFYKKHHYPND